MLNVACPECGNPLRASGSQISRVPGAEWQTHIDYQCEDPQCSGRLRVSMPRQGLRGSTLDVDPVAD